MAAQQQLPEDRSTGRSMPAQVQRAAWRSSNLGDVDSTIEQSLWPHLSTRSVTMFSSASMLAVLSECASDFQVSLGVAGSDSGTSRGFPYKHSAVRLVGSGADASLPARSHHTAAERRRGPLQTMADCSPIGCRCNYPALAYHCEHGTGASRAVRLPERRADLFDAGKAAACGHLPCSIFNRRLRLAVMSCADMQLHQERCSRIAGTLHASDGNVFSVSGQGSNADGT